MGPRRRPGRSGVNLLVTLSRKAVNVRAPFMVGPDGVFRLRFRCPSETDAIRLREAVWRR